MKLNVSVAAVAENREPMLHEVYWLFHSLRNFGGELSDARAIVYFVDSMPAETSHFKALGVEIKLVVTIDSRSPHCNKIHMLLDEYETDWLIAMDVDTIITGDFSAYLEEPVVSAKIVDQNPLSEELWKRFYRHFGMSLPEARYLTHFQAKESNPYFNSGVLLIPGGERVMLGKVWLQLVSEVLSVYPLEPEISKHSFFTDQFAFALALTKLGLDHRCLPLEMNFPTHSPIHPMFVSGNVKPLVLHYHHNIDKHGRIKHCTYPAVNELIDRFNLSLASNAVAP